MIHWEILQHELTLKILRWIKEASHRTPCFMWFQLCVISQRDTSLQRQEVTQWLSGVGGKWDWLPRGTGFLSGVKKASNVDCGGDGSTILWINQKPLKCSTLNEWIVWYTDYIAIQLLSHFFFSGCTGGTWTFLGQGLNPSTTAAVLDPLTYCAQPDTEGATLRHCSQILNTLCPSRNSWAKCLQRIWRGSEAMFWWG